MIEATATTSPRSPAARLEFPLVPEKLEAAVSTRRQKIPIQGTSLTGVDLLKPYLGKLLTPIATPASFHGFSPETFELIVPLMRSVGIEPLMGGAMVPTVQASSGSIELSVDQSLAPGAAVGVGLVTGDLDISATGTVTHVDPLTKAVYAFGHPLFNLGPIEYPMTLANVHIVLPSLYSSFKLASTGPTVGTWVQDRNVAIKGVLGSRPKMIPMSVQIQTSRGKEKSYSLEIVNDELFTPVLAYASLASILQSTERDFGSQTVQISALVSMNEDRRVIIDDIFAGQQSALSASAMVAAPLSFLMTNDFSEIQVKEVRVNIEAVESLKTARLVRAWLDRSEVAPGGSVPLKVLLRTYRGEEKLDEYDIDIPSNAEEGQLQLLVADAGTISTIERRMTRSSFEPRNLNQLIRALNGIRKNNRLYVRLSRPNREGAILAGEYMSSLPPSVLNVLKADQSSGNYIPIRNSMLWEGEMVTDYSVTGSRVLEITVKNP
jgi:hypothetical protein